MGLGSKERTTNQYALRSHHRQDCEQLAAAAAEQYSCVVQASYCRVCKRLLLVHCVKRGTSILLALATL